MAVTVRLTTQEDRALILPLIKGYLDFYEVAHPADEKLHDLLDTLARQPERGVQFIAELDGEPVGFATLYSTFSTLRAQHAMVMNDLFVKAEARKHGVGQALFKACEHYVRDNGYAFLEWVTARDNETAQRFYDAQGAKRSDWIVYSV